MSHHVSKYLVVFAVLVLLQGVSASQASDPSGRWTGTWSSGATGHRGTLRARIRPVNGQTYRAQTYRALFAGRFAKVIPFVYPAKLTRVPGTFDRYESSTRLPLLGEYRMRATISADRFYATFQGRSDSGIFQMTR